MERMVHLQWTETLISIQEINFCNVVIPDGTMIYMSASIPQKNVTGYNVAVYIHVLGKVVAKVHVIEFQKRILPHATY